MLELRRIGVWTAGDGAPQSSLLLSSHETDVPRKHEAAAGARDPASHWAGGGNWSMAFLWLVLALLLMESWLFHRQAVY
jgi:hypothetical protein